MNGQQEVERMRKECTEEHVRLIVESFSVKPGKDARQLHKKLRQYGSGLPMSLRWPNLPMWISLAAAASAAAKVILDAMR